MTVKVVEGKFKKKEKAKPSDVLQVAADMASEVEDEGIDFEVAVIVQMKGVPSILMSNETDMTRLRMILDFATEDLKLAIWEDMFGIPEESDETLH